MSGTEDVRARVEVWRAPDGRLRLRAHHRTRRLLTAAGAKFDAAGAADVADAIRDEVLAAVPASLRAQLDHGVRFAVSRRDLGRWCLAATPRPPGPDPIHLVTHVAGLGARELAALLLGANPARRLASALEGKARERDADVVACATEQFADLCRRDAADLRVLAARLRGR